MPIPLHRLLFSLLATCVATAAIASPATDKVLQNVRLPGGFQLEVYADNVPAARSMALGSQGTLFVGTRGTTVYAVSGSPGTGLKPTVRVIADKLNMPNGVAFRDGSLYVAEVHRITRYDAIESSLTNIPAPKVVRDDLPTARHHVVEVHRVRPGRKAVCADRRALQCL